MIFCRGWTGMSGVHDIKLRAYLRWVATGRIQAEAAAKRRTAGPRKRKGEGNYLSASISAEIQGQSLLGPMQQCAEA